ncbi:unnamed protein product, partial [Polarella glacialis]
MDSSGTLRHGLTRITSGSESAEGSSKTRTPSLPPDPLSLSASPLSSASAPPRAVSVDAAAGLLEDQLTWSVRSAYPTLTSWPSNSAAPSLHGSAQVPVAVTPTVPVPREHGDPGGLRTTGTAQGVAGPQVGSDMQVTRSWAKVQYVVRHAG